MILTSSFHAKLKIAEDNVCKSHCSNDQTLINGVDFGIWPSYSHLMPMNCFIDIKAKTFFIFGFRDNYLRTKFRYITLNSPFKIQLCVYLTKKYTPIPKEKIHIAKF